MIPFNTQGFLDYLRIIAILKQIGVETIEIIISGPNIKDEEAFRNWLRAIVKVGRTLAVATPMIYDDAVISVLEALVESDSAWHAFYGMVQALLDGQDVAKDNPAAIIAHEMVKQFNSR